MQGRRLRPARRCFDASAATAIGAGAVLFPCSLAKDQAFDGILSIQIWQCTQQGFFAGKFYVIRDARRWLVAASLLVLAACQRDNSSVPASTAAAAGVPLTTISALIWAPDWPDEMDKVAAAFTRLNPDIKVDVQFMIGNSVEENIQPKLASRKLPDLMSVNPNPYAAALAERGVLADVGHIAAWAKLLPSLKSDWITPDGKRFGIAATVMYYNKAMFAKAGVTRLPT